MRKIAALACVAALALGATACDNYNDERGKGDAPVAGKRGDDSPKHVTNNPDDFPNVVTGCVFGAKGFRYFENTHGQLRIERDPAC